MRRIIAIVGLVLACACSASTAPTVDRQPPHLSNGEVERLMLRADDIKRSSPGQAGLAGVFRGRALQLLGAQAESFERRGIRVEERNISRTLVFWDARAAEAVLEVISQRRIVTRDDPNLGWNATVRQWWARLQFADGGWWIVDEQDLAPDRWRAMGRWASGLALGGDKAPHLIDLTIPEVDFLLAGPAFSLVKY